jgi:hypothetical protein
MRVIYKAVKACLCALAFLYASCNFTGDDIIPTNFEPVAWKDSMIFLATDEGPPQVQIWDTETRTLVRRVMFPENMFFGNSIVTDKECAWLILVGRKEHLIQLNAITGKINTVNLDINPNEMQFINGVLWVWNPYSNRSNGVRFRMFDRTGKLQQSVTMNLHGIDRVGQDSIVYIDGNFLIPLRTFHGRFYIANLSKGGAPTEIPLKTLFPGGLLENFSTVVYDPWVYPPDPRESSLRFYEEGYTDIIFSSAELIWRWYYKIESYIPFKLSDPLITYHRHGNRSNLFLSRTDNHIFVGGGLKGRGSSTNFNGVEIGVYPAEGGEELMYFRLLQGNNHYVKRESEIWVAKDIWLFNYETNQWNFKGETEAYFLDKINLKLYRVSANGTVVLVQES